MAMTGPLNADQRRALVLLSEAGPYGYTEHVLIVHGFTKQLLADLVRDGLATRTPETVRAGGGRSVDVARLRITDAGRRAMEGR
jgi:hypothetical protein